MKIQFRLRYTGDYRSLDLKYLGSMIERKISLLKILLHAKAS